MKHQYPLVRLLYWVRGAPLVVALLVGGCSSTLAIWTTDSGNVPNRLRIKSDSFDADDYPVVVVRGAKDRYVKVVLSSEGSVDSAQLEESKLLTSDLDWIEIGEIPPGQYTVELFGSRADAAEDYLRTSGMLGLALYLEEIADILATGKEWNERASASWTFEVLGDSLETDG